MSNIYPATPVPAEGIAWNEEFLTALAGPYPAGQTVGTALRSYPMGHFAFSYRYLTLAEAHTVSNFVSLMRGRAGTFTFKDWWSQPWTRRYVGTGLAGATIFDLPFVNTTGLVLRKGVTTLTLGADYTFGSGTGADGRDRITLAAHADGYVLEADATAQLVVLGRLTADTIAFHEGEAGVWSSDTVEVREEP